MSGIATEEFHGWLSHSHAAADGKMEWAAFTPRPFQDDDIDIAVTHCAICHTDHGILAGELGPIDFPVCVGHEIVGHVVRVGPKAHQQFAVGDRVGVGAQSDACLNRPFLQSKPGHEHDSAGDGKTETLCSSCSTGQEQYCPKFIATYGSQRHYDGSIAMGGYATHIRTKSHFVFPIPDQLASADAAPMLCGGITTYSPLVRHGCGPGKSVAIVGLGGLGHFGVLWAKALKADSILAISRSKSKKDDALKLGCDEYLASAEDGYAEAIKEREGTLDIILCTVSNAATDLSSYFSLLKPGGTFVLLGLAEGGKLQVPVLPLLMKRVNVVGSLIGSPTEIAAMFELAVQEKVQPWVQERDMADANQALLDIAAGKARYRLCLVNKST